MSADPKLSSWEEAVVWFRNQPEQQQVARDAYYDDPLVDAAARYHASEEWRAVSRILHGRRGRALDIGAGRGIASYALARDGFAVTALEPDPSKIVGAAAIRMLAHDAGIAIDIVEEVSERLPFADASFDVVFARAVLHHTTNLEDACREIYRVLKPGGIAVAAREHVISRDSDLQKFLDQHPLHRLYGGENAFRLDRYVGALRTAGFEPLEILPPLTSPINLFPYTIESLRSAVVSRLSAKLPVPCWRALLSHDRMFRFMLSIAEQFDNRPGRLYSFVGYKPQQ
ncbi:class I SAM-dependent methyltransferase [Bradyrhizobium sp. OAE829]|uniref:class I SAM-dependent methyltransferase n=1 Tax=Bradyrhizobium sp. OAE829 TaxID=2663807 RepID=UPI00178B0949